MMKAQDFSGDLSKYIYGFLEYVDVSKSYKVKLFSHMRILDAECLSTEHTSGLLDEELVMALHPRKNDEDIQAWKQRNCSLRKFAYLVNPVRFITRIREFFITEIR